MSLRSIRSEKPEDIRAIRALHRHVFNSDLEGTLVDRLREDGDHVLSLVAEQNGQILGHLLFSELEAPFKALALAPLAVSPDHQGKGIGWQLVTHSHAWAVANGWDAIFVLGNPDYYAQFGYKCDAAAGYDSPYRGEYFMIKSFRPYLPPRGVIEYAPAFSMVAAEVVEAV